MGEVEFYEEESGGYKRPGTETDPVNKNLAQGRSEFAKLLIKMGLFKKESVARNFLVIISLIIFGISLYIFFSDFRL